LPGVQAYVAVALMRFLGPELLRAAAGADQLGLLHVQHTASGFTLTGDVLGFVEELAQQYGVLVEASLGV
jgi:hypothetical protein